MQTKVFFNGYKACRTRTKVNTARSLPAKLLFDVWIGECTTAFRDDCNLCVYNLVSSQCIACSPIKRDFCLESDWFSRIVVKNVVKAVVENLKLSMPPVLNLRLRGFKEGAL